MHNTFKIKVILSWLLFASILLFEPLAHSQLKTKETKPASSKATEKDSKARKPQTSNGIHVMSVDPNFSAEELEEDGYIVHGYERTERQIEAEESLDPIYRDQLIVKSGLSANVQNWDHAQRDMLYLRALNYTYEKLRSKYPSFPQRQLQKFHILVQSGKRQ